MKKLRFAGMALMFVVGLTAVSFAKTTVPPTAQGSQVVLNWSEFIKLWNDANKPPDPPKPNPAPFDYILSRSQYNGTVQPQATEIKARFELEILNSKTWVKVPFLPSSLGLKEARLDGQPVAVAQDGSFHTLILKGKGQRTLDVVFSIPSPDKDGAPVLNFPVAQTAMTLLNLTFPQPKLEFTVDPAQVLATKNENGKTTLQAILKPTQRIRVTWQKQLPPNQQLPTKIYSNVENLLTIKDSALGIKSYFQYSILHSGINQVQVRLPDNVTILGVFGDGIQNWKTETRDQENILRVFFNRKMKGRRTVTIHSEVPLKNEPVVEIPFLRTIGVEREEGAVGVEAKSTVEVSVEDQKGLRQVDVKELPRGLWNQAASPLLYGFTYTKPNITLALGIERHEAVPVLTSTIDIANAVTVFTKDGQWITRSSFQVRNHLKQFLTLDLPESAKIWSAFVGGKPVKPSRNKDGQIMIPLRKSNLNSQNASFTVEVIYHKQSNNLGLSGARQVFLPKADLPISQSLWSVYVPEEYEFPFFGGNMDKSHAARGISPVLGGNINYRRNYNANMGEDQKKNAVKEMSEVIRWDMARGKKQAIGASMTPYAEEALHRQAEMEMDAIVNDGPVSSTELTPSVLPVAFRIPQVGKVFRFGKIMVTESIPTIKVNYVRSDVIAFVEFLMFGLALLILYRIRNRIREGFHQMAKNMKPFVKRLGRIKWFSSRPTQEPAAH